MLTKQSKRSRSFLIPHPFAFPLGSDRCTSLWAYTCGKVRPQLKNASNEIAASEVTCSAYGGTNGISYSFTIEGADGKLRRIGGAHFPMTGTLAAGESFVRRVRYDAFAPSTNVEDIVVRASYTENGTGAADSKDEKITAVKVRVEATASFPVVL